MTVTEESPESLPERDVGDATAALMRGALGSLPIVGGLAAELWSYVLGAPLDRRRDEWLRNLAESVEDLRRLRTDVSWESLQQDETFIDTVLQTSASAIKTHHDEKLRALRNAVLNVVGQTELEADESTLFIQMVDDLTPWHLRVLAFMDNPRATGELSGRILAPPSTIFKALCKVHRQLEARTQFVTQLVRDLYARGLLERQDIHANYVGGGESQRHTTQWGQRFLRFISDPTTGAPPTEHT